MPILLVIVLLAIVVSVVRSTAVDCSGLETDLDQNLIALCRQLEEAGVDANDDVYCGTLGEEPTVSEDGVLQPSFRMADILEADDMDSVFFNNVKRCTRRRLHRNNRRQLLTKDYGWCSMNMKFLLRRKKQFDTSSYCHDEHCNAEIGCGTHLSACCKLHDVCSSCEDTELCSASTYEDHGECDRELAICAGVDNVCNYKIKLEPADSSTDSSDPNQRRLFFGFFEFDLPSIDIGIDFPSIDILLPDFSISLPDIFISLFSIHAYDFTCGAASAAVEAAMITQPNKGKTCVE